jgi:DHA1 family putative efflux transporter-like MFS transporter
VIDAAALLVSFFWLGGYFIAYTYISLLLTITGMGEKR